MEDCVTSTDSGCAHTGSDRLSETFVSVLTPTRNRAHLLHRVWAGLDRQTLRSFEWIVADDGSEDDTARVVHELASRSDFPVLYIRASTHVGKPRIDNEAIQRARGEFLMWCDSDDWLLPEAIGRLRACWYAIPVARRPEYVGITALTRTADDPAPTPLPASLLADVTWNDLSEVHRVTGDMLFFVRSCCMRQQPFPEVDLVVPESVVWSALGERKTRFLPQPLKVIEYQGKHGISFSGLMAYNRGRAHAVARITRNLRHYRTSWRTRWWRVITFLRYCRHGEIGLREAVALWADNNTHALLVASIPFAWALAAKDAIQGKVRKTHRQFLAGKDDAVITVQSLKIK